MCVKVEDEVLESGAEAKNQAKRRERVRNTAMSRPRVLTPISQYPKEYNENNDMLKKKMVKCESKAKNSLLAGGNGCHKMQAKKART